MPERLSVVIPNWNGARFLRVCLDSLRRQSCADFAVYLVDNGSADESLQLLREEYPEVHVIARPDNGGFALGCNDGIRASKGELVALLNNDTEADVRWVEELLALADARPEAGCFSSKVLDFKSRNIIDSFGDAYTFLGLAAKIGSRREDGDAYAAVVDIISPCGAASVYRRSMLDEVGLLDEDFFCYMEDVDLGLRAQLYGYRCLTAPRALIYHIGSASSGGGSSEFTVFMTTRNLYSVLLKNMPMLLLPGMLMLAFAAQMLLVTRAWLGFSGGAKLRPHLRGYWRGLRAAAAHAPRMWGKRRTIQRARRIGAAHLFKLINASTRQLRETPVRGLPQN